MLPTHRVSYEVEFGLLQRALDSRKGARVRVKTLEAGIHLRARIHQARKIDRRDSKDVYDPESPAYGQSIFDKLVCRLKKIDDRWWLYIEHRNAEVFEVEDLEEEPVIAPPAAVRRAF